MHKLFALLACMLLLAVGCSKPSEVREATDEHSDTATESAAPGEGDPEASGAPSSSSGRGRSSAVVGGGGNDGDSTDDPAEPGVSVPPVSQGPTVGVTATTIKLGFIVVSNNDKLLSGYGVRGGAIGDTREQVQAVVDDINSRGILGRKIVPAIRELSATGDGTEQYNAMCAGFTQDDKVFAVFSPWNPDPAFGPCLAKKGTFLITDALLQYDAETFKQFSPYIVSGLFSSSRGAVAFAHGLHKQGYFKGAKVGVVHSDNPIYKRVYDRYFKPTLASLGVKVSAVFAASGTGGANDAVLYMAERDITHVVFLSAAGGNPLFFMTAAQGQAYNPIYGLASPDSPAFLAQNAPYTQLRGAKAVGWVPAFDVLDSEGPPLTANEKRCLAAHSKAGTDYGTRTEAAAIAMAFCDMAWLFEEASNKAGKNLTKQGWANAVGALGTAHKTTLTFGTKFAPGGFDGAVSYRPMSYDDSPSCRCFKYTGSMATVGR